MNQRILKNQRWLVRRVSLILALIVAMSVTAGGESSAVMAGNNVRYFAFVAVSEAESDDDMIHRIGTHGSGTFDPDTGWVRGGGSFEWFDAAAEGVPKPSLGSAKWVVARLVNWTPCIAPDTCTAEDTGAAGHITAGVIDLEVTIHFDDGRKIRRAPLKLICNIGFAGLMNKDPETDDILPEGFFLTYRDPEMGTMEFKPLDPVLGLTHIGYIPPQELR